MRIFRILDKLEDKIRFGLSRWPIVYTLIGGVAIVLFWRGVWLTADLYPFLTGPVSLAISVIVLLAIGLFVSFFIGDQILISGLKQEKKITEKTESEIKEESAEIHEIEKQMEIILRELSEIKNKLDGYSK